MQRITSQAVGLLARLAGMLLGVGLAVILVTGVAAADPASSASAYSANSSVQQVSQRQKTFTIAVPVTVLSGNAVSVLSSGDTASNSFSGVVVAPTQSSSQSNRQYSRADGRGSGRGQDCGCGQWHHAKSGGNAHAHASSYNSSVQQSGQRQSTFTVAVPVTVLSGNAVSVGSSGDTTSHSFSGVVVAPSQSSRQTNRKSSRALACGMNQPRHGKGCGSSCGGYAQPCKTGSSGRAYASSHNSSVQQSRQSQKTVTVAVPVTVLSGNAVSVLSSGNTTSHSFSGVVVAPSQSNSQSSVQSSAASAGSSLGGCGH